jgi:hypothetical protein
LIISEPPVRRPAFAAKDVTGFLATPHTSSTTRQQRREHLKSLLHETLAER